MSGFFTVGIYSPKRGVNVGGILRSAHAYGAAGVSTIGHRYNQRDHADTSKAPRNIPFTHFSDQYVFLNHLPLNARLVGVELVPGAARLHEYKHPKQAVYLFGAEDHGIPSDLLDECDDVVTVATAVPWSLNVASTASIVLHHRHTQKAPCNA